MMWILSELPTLVFGQLQLQLINLNAKPVYVDLFLGTVDSAAISLRWSYLPRRLQPPESHIFRPASGSNQSAHSGWNRTDETSGAMVFCKSHKVCAGGKR
jgi:hypothetical protein